MRWAVDAAGMRAIDSHAVNCMGVPGRALMESAGRSVAEVAAGRVESGRMVFLCGPGSNGGDGLVAARLLKERGYPVAVLLMAEDSRLVGDSARALILAREAGVSVVKVTTEAELAAARQMLCESGLVVDALLGTGSRGPPRDLMGTAVEWLQEIKAPVLAVDIPTGVDSDTGQVAGPAVQAVATVTMGLLKTGMLFHPGCELVGKLMVADIGLPRELVVSPEGGVEILESGDLATYLPKIKSTVHKTECGRILVVAGSTGMTGAAALCCAAALRVGAGLVYLAIPDHLNGVLEAMLPETITIPVPSRDGMHCREALETLRGLLSRVDVVVLGPGLGRGAGPAELVPALLSSWRGPLVLDADGLFYLPSGMTHSSDVVLTPHMGEMARLSGCSADFLETNRLSAARLEASRRRATVVLKGVPTVVTQAGATTGVNLTGNAGLATGGSGDVLSGTIAGFMAQGAGSFRAAMAGAFVHGVAADLALEEMPQASVLPTDVVRLLPRALRTAGFGDRTEPRPWWKQ